MFLVRLRRPIEYLLSLRSGLRRTISNTRVRVPFRCSLLPNQLLNDLNLKLHLLRLEYLLIDLRLLDQLLGLRRKTLSYILEGSVDIVWLIVYQLANVLVAFRRVQVCRLEGDLLHCLNRLQIITTHIGIERKLITLVVQAFGHTGSSNASLRIQTLHHHEQLLLGILLFALPYSWLRNWIFGVVRVFLE
jgi:hypothetical protein